MTEGIRRRVILKATEPFSRVPHPLTDTLSYTGDPGLLGPGSVSWRVIGDVSSLVGGLRALLVQSTHPEVVAGVHYHSRYHEDPLGRLSRTSAYVTATTYGAMPEVKAAVEKVRRIHRPVRGSTIRGRPYDADDPALGAWVHNALTHSFLVAYQEFGPDPLDAETADRFVAEQTAVGRLLDADPLPETAAALEAWLLEHPDLDRCPETVRPVAFLVDPPLDPILRFGYRILLGAATTTLPDRFLDILELRRRRWGAARGRVLFSWLRWAMGASPSWEVALIRCGAPVPPRLFKQPLPV